MLRVNQPLMTEFEAAIRDGNLAQAKSLAVSNPDEIKPLMNHALLVAVDTGNAETTAWLLSKQANPNQLSDNKINLSLLQHAVKNQNFAVAECLLKRKANADHLDHTGNSALHYAIENEDQAMTELLLNFKANINQRGKSIVGNSTKGKLKSTPFGLALRCGNVEIFKLVNAGNPQEFNQFLKSHPDIFNYVCANASVPNEKKAKMINFLLTEFPEILMVENILPQISKLQEVVESFKKIGLPNSCALMLAARRNVTAFHLEYKVDNKVWSEKQLAKAITYIDDSNNSGSISDIQKFMNTVLASDLLKIMDNKHPIISEERFQKVCTDILVPFSSHHNAVTCGNLGKIIQGACQEVLASNNADSVAGQKLIKLTLLMLAEAHAHGKEWISHELAQLIHANLPEASGFEIETGIKGHSKLEDITYEFGQPLKQLLASTKEFYIEWCKVRLSANQINPCSRLEQMISLGKIVQLNDNREIIIKEAAFEFEAVNSSLLNSYYHHDIEIAEQKAVMQQQQTESAQAIATLQAELIAQRAKFEADTNKLKYDLAQQQATLELLQSEQLKPTARTSSRAKTKPTVAVADALKPSRSKKQEREEEFTAIPTDTPDALMLVTPDVTEMPMIKKFKLFQQPAVAAAPAKGPRRANNRKGK